MEKLKSRSTMYLHLENDHFVLIKDLNMHAESCICKHGWQMFKHRGHCQCRCESRVAVLYVGGPYSQPDQVLFH